MAQEAPPVAPAPKATAAPAPAAETPGPSTAPAAPPVNEKLADLWDNFLYYILVARTDLAAKRGQEILDARPDPKELYYVSLRSADTPKTLARGRNVKELAPIIDPIIKLVDEGARAVRTDPTEIKRWIEMLSGSPRQFLSATERLVNSGEYAIPQLVFTLADPKTSALTRERIVSMLPRMGKDAVRPLSEALAVPDPATQEILCQVLGQIGYRHAAPYLKQLAETKGIPQRTQQAALNALAAVYPRGLKKPVAELFYETALDYYRCVGSVAPDSRYDTANLWHWQQAGSVTYVVAPTAIFGDLYAMRLAQAALRHDESFDPAVTLWLAANLRKEAAIDAGVKDPTRLPEDPTADLYALASSAKNLQLVLELALRDNDTAVATRAISALRQSAGAENLLTAIPGGAQPLVAALSYPVRTVRFLAAEALALALPTKSFTGSQLVVPALIEMLRQTGTPLVVLADPDQQHRNKVKDLLRTAGMEVVDGPTLGPTLQAARSSGGVDMLVLASNLSAPDLAKAVQLLRADASLARTPLLLVARGAETGLARDLAKGDPAATALSDEELTDAAIKAALAKGGMSATTAPAAGAPAGDAAVDWAVRAAKAMKLLAVTRNPVYDLTDAAKSLMAATKDKRDPVRIAAAAALADIRDAAGQQALADLALDTDASDDARLAGFAALSESIRQFGGLLTDKQIKAIVDTVNAKGSLKIRDGAAAVMGSLALPPDKAKALILNAK